MTENNFPELPDETIVAATLNAADILSGMGYTGRHGSIHLLDLRLQTNTVTAILHNIIAWQIGEIDSAWTFRPKGGPTPDLLVKQGHGIQIKVTSNKYDKGNRVSPNEGYYLVVKFERKSSYEITIREFLSGTLSSGDWDRPSGTQWAILRKEAERKLRRIYP